MPNSLTVLLVGVLAGAILFPGAVCGQTAQESATAGCGPLHAEFRVSLAGEAQAAPALNANQALVYFIGYWPGPYGPAVRVGADGSWTGAIKGFSFLPVAMLAGEHHFCAEFPLSNTFETPPAVALHVIDLKAGETYYLLSDLSRAQRTGLLLLEEVNADEGRLLLSKAKQAEAQPKK